jgi:signal transduction histidine kinase
MEEALEHLLDNALKFTPAGGRVRLSLERTSGGILTRVEDTGEGIPPGNMDRIFDRFFSTKPKDGAAGNGLGLAIARAAVERHGGAISAERRSEGGTIFTLFITIA